MNPRDMLFNKTVKKELEFGVNYFKYKINKKGIRCSEALKLVGLPESFLDKKISDLTLTEQKKVSLAAVLRWTNYRIRYNWKRKLKKINLTFKRKIRKNYNTFN